MVFVRGLIYLVTQIYLIVGKRLSNPS
jgi:hypothetical protein